MVDLVNKKCFICKQFINFDQTLQVGIDQYNILNGQISTDDVDLFECVLGCCLIRLKHNLFRDYLQELIRGSKKLDWNCGFKRYTETMNKYEPENMRIIYQNWILPAVCKYYNIV